MHVIMDINRVFLASKALKIQLDYEKLFDALAEYAAELGEATVSLTGFSIISSANKRQVHFLSRLGELGMTVHSYNSDLHRPSFTECVSALMGHSLGGGAEHVVVVSDDPELVHVFNLFYPDRGRLHLAFFSDTLDGAWAQKILRDKTPFLDMSELIPRVVLG